MTPRWLERLAAHAPLGAAREALARDGVARLSGPTASARLLIPFLLTERPLLVVVSRERDLEATADDLRTWATTLGLSGQVMTFPSPGPLPLRGLGRHAEASWRRAAALFAAARGSLRAVVASPTGLLRPVLAPQLFATRVVNLRRGDEMLPELLLEALDEAGYRHEDPVTAPGQLARRGGILDLFPPDHPAPIRVELFGDTIESLRHFEVESQRSSEALEAIDVPPLSDLFITRTLRGRLRERLAQRFAGDRALGPLLDRLDRGTALEELVEYLPLVPEATVPPWEHLSGFATVVVEPDLVEREASAQHERAALERAEVEGPTLEPEELLVAPEALNERLTLAPSIAVSEFELDRPTAALVCRAAPRYGGDLRRLLADVGAGGRTVAFLGTNGRADRLRDHLREQGQAVGDEAAVDLTVGPLSAGFELPELGLRVLADGDVFPEEVHLHGPTRRGALKGGLFDFRDLRAGDLVVHQDHGIARFVGLETLEVAGTVTELMVLAYKGGDRLKVPVYAFDRVQRYKGADATRPQLDQLGSGRWDKIKKRVKKAMREMAAELLRLYAERKARPGRAFSQEGPWLREFEDSFDYDETPDQAAAIADVGRDMTSASPMDRLVCGDVGYGKTEVAMRAAMRAVVDGAQVALLTPTTVLAFQHWKTFRKRFAPFPVAVEMVSRLRSPREVKDVLKRLAEGRVDIVIGTHRLLSKDVVFKDLGLVIVDEEQRFGVAAKERLKHLRTTVDCLTLTATPIPRTLQMGLAGIRDMSVIETPPKDRLAIQTSIVKFATEAIAVAIRQELAREGQVFLVHNRIESIYSLANLVTRLCPEARVAVAHGQMSEGELEGAMLAFVEGRADVLVATTLIENGLDIPRANTIIVNRADRYGLAQLYQLRGRVGRSDRRAHALLLVPPDTVLSEIARKRLAAIRDFSDLGSGFRIAALDLELRGAGNLLGGQQSGHIEAVGLDLYIKLLEQTILELKGESWREASRLTMNIGVDLRIPAAYVPDAEQRMSLYKRLSQAGTLEDVEPIRAELRDRFGPLPNEVEVLLGFVRCRVRAARLGFAQVERAGGQLVARFEPDAPLRPEAIVSLVHRRAGASLSPQGALRVPIDAHKPALQVLEELLASLEAA